MPGEKILIVDDEPLICSALSRELRGAGYNVDSVFSGEEALEAVKQKSYSLMLIDKNMPCMNGIEACGRIKKICSDLIAIFITGEHAMREAEMEAAGGRVCLYKPFAQGEVKEQIKKALSEKK